ncbi:HXXEE domain-containing protein [candidate division KSB1 bacterium]|nr:HXXEE domain-containing protein [candidate division KSB1 bacterium]
MDSIFHLAQIKDQAVRKHSFAWIALCLALAVHVIDETLTDFLSVYNPAVQAIRSKFPLLPLPTFSFEVWLSGLIFAILLSLSLSILVFRGSKWMMPLSYFFAVIMLLNGALHITGSFYFGRMMPGVYSSPLLLAGSIYLFVCTRKEKKP